jgi:hypothetical protein
MVLIIKQGKVLLVFLFIFLISNGCAAVKDILLSPPLKGVKPQMEDYHYWTEKLTTPQSDLLTHEEIDYRNRLLIKRKDLYMNNLSDFPDTLPKEEIEEMFELGKMILHKELYSHINYPMDQEKKTEIMNQLNLDSIPPLRTVQWALTIRECNIRALPTNKLAMEKADDYQFDQFQFTKINPGEALAVIHNTIDGQWSFVVSYFAQGWIESQDIALAYNKETVLDFFKASAFIVYTGESGDLYYDRECTRFAMEVRMGMKLPLIEEGEDYFCVRTPILDMHGRLSFAKGYLAKDSSVNIGFLPFTQENVARLAFLLKGSSYGWGGMFDGRDCSRFIFDIFKCMDLLLPRNSRSQSEAGLSSMDLTGFSPAQKEAIVVEKGVPFATLLNLPGHVMLYIGKEGNKPYVIHSLWAYRENVLLEDRLRNVSQIVVSDLHLGEGSKKGSLLERLSGMTFLVNKHSSLTDWINLMR